MKHIKPIFLILVSGFIMSLARGAAFANSALDQLNSANINAAVTYDGAISHIGDPVPVSAAAGQTYTPSAVNASPARSAGVKAAPPPPPAPAKPSIVKNMAKDVVANRGDYVIACGAAALTGFLLMGTMAAAFTGFGLFFVFLLLYRNAF